MELSNLRPAKGSTHHDRRLGRGQGSGLAGTSTRGHKGAKSRSGYHKKRGFEGGQMPLQRRLPKFGFTPMNRVAYKAVNLGILQQLADQYKLTSIDKETLIGARVVSKNDLVKILGKGKITSPLSVKADAFSSAAAAAIEAAGGTVEVLS